MTIDQALFEMELVGHDFFLFTDAASGLPSVVYRRRGYQYGVIRLVEEHAARGSGAAPARRRGAGANGRAPAGVPGQDGWRPAAANLPAAPWQQRWRRPG